MTKWAYYNDNDEKKLTWVRELMKAGLITPGETDGRPIQSIHPDDLKGFRRCHFFCGIAIWDYALRLAGWEDDREVWTGSCPCQPFSAAGKGAAFNDERHLWPVWFPLIEARRPVVCFGEQVSSIDGLAWFDTVRADLDNAGYTYGVLDTSAAGVGGPHRRQRLYWVAHSEGSGSWTGLRDIGPAGIRRHQFADRGGAIELGIPPSAGPEERGDKPGHPGQERASVKRTGGIDGLENAMGSLHKGIHGDKGMSAERLFYIQNRGYVGNCLIWWRDGGHGYTTNLDEAWKVSKKKAKSICRDRPNEDFAHPVELIDSIAHRHVNCEELRKALA